MIKGNKIAMLLPSLLPGGMERVMTELANYFSSEKGIEVHLILYGKSCIFYDLNSEIIIHIKQEVFSSKRRYLESIKRMVYIRRCIKEIGATTVLSFGTQWNNFVLMALIGMPVRIFVSDRGSPARKYKKLQEILKTILYKNAAGIIVQTSLAHEITRKRFPNSRVVSIGNPIRAINVNKQQKNENIILSVGRLISTKHHDRMINTFSKIEAPGWKLIIVGGDALKQHNSKKLFDLINDLNLQEKVFLAGEQKDVDRYYQSSKIFVFTSSVEGFPNVVGEALSAGLPVISYDCIAGPSEMVINGYNGFLVSLFDDEHFKLRLEELIRNEKLRQEMSEHARTSIDKYSIDVISNKYLEFMSKSD